MVWFLGLAAGLWFLGRRLGASANARWGMIGLLYAAVLGLLAAVPPDHAVRRVIGGTLGEWLVLGGLFAAILGYGRVIGGLKARARAAAPEPKPQAAGTYAPGETQRYARHIMLREIGGPGQKALKQAKVLVVGAGGLGSPALLYLAAAGIGRIGVIDEDVVEASNLQRQVIHTEDRIGMPKVFSAQSAMQALNPHVDLRPYHRRLTGDIAADLMDDYDLVLDGTDNFDTRYLVNRACVERSKPLISGALTQWEGQLSLFHPAAGAPCYRCIFPEPPASGLVPSCAEAGVLGPLPGIVGAMMAAEAIKHLAGAGQTLAGRMLIHDALWGESRVMKLHRRPGCPDCGHLP